MHFLLAKGTFLFDGIFIGIGCYRVQMKNIFYLKVHKDTNATMFDLLAGNQRYQDALLSSFYFLAKHRLLNSLSSQQDYQFPAEEC